MPLKFCVSEEEAKFKTCPLSFPTVADSIGPFSCVGASCMAWRYVWTTIDDGKGELVASGDTHGYCGLAGRPFTNQ